MSSDTTIRDLLRQRPRALACEKPYTNLRAAPYIDSIRHIIVQQTTTLQSMIMQTERLTLSMLRNLHEMDEHLERLRDCETVIMLLAPTPPLSLALPRPQVVVAPKTQDDEDEDDLYELPPPPLLAKDNAAAQQPAAPAPPVTVV
jgi:hypothetical protein